MKPISQKILRDAAWQCVYTYSGKTLSFVIFACDALPGITIAHERAKGYAKAKTIYTVNRKRTESPSQAVRIYNAQAREQANLGRPAAGSVESLGSARGTTGVRQ